jgi:hypothetical protein
VHPARRLRLVPESVFIDALVNRLTAKELFVNPLIARCAGQAVSIGYLRKLKARNLILIVSDGTLTDSDFIELDTAIGETGVILRH